MLLQKRVGDRGRVIHRSPAYRKTLNEIGNTTVITYLLGKHGFASMGQRCLKSLCSGFLA